MIRVYTVKNKELFETDVRSKEEMDNISAKVKRAWVDCSDPDAKEVKIVSDLLEVEEKTLNGIKNGNIRQHYAKCFDEMCPYYTWISTPVVEFKNTLKLHPMSIILKERFLVTLRNKHSERLIESTLRTFNSLPPEQRKPTVILCKLIHEIIDENSGAMVAIRDLIDNLEAEAMEEKKKKAVTKSIFKLKRSLSTLHRLLWAEKEMLSDLDLGVIPNLRLVREAKLIVEDASDDITRELEFIDSFNRSLDSILRLQDLGAIHRVETNLVNLTVALVILTIVLVL
ncbi:MAG: CorA family divalent cation transporter, partial [Candidatus Wukongarchaeota archaeon]|nr:CorA family divalent cation transporter [Candidatus Wukongarchaeota archaeon]